MEDLFHLFSCGSESADLFLSDAEKDLALNRIAVVSSISDTTVLAFDIEDTHLHLFVSGKWESVITFKTEYQKRTRDHITRNRDNPQLLPFTLELLPVSESEYAKTLAAYVICQATKDGKGVMPYDYRWSSASLYFRKTNKDLLWRIGDNLTVRKSVTMKDLSLNYQREYFHVSDRLPDHWEVCDGIILPSSFVDISSFEKLFKTHNAFRVFCGSSAKRDTDIVDEMVRAVGITIDDNEAKSIASKLSKVMFGKKNVRELDVQQRLDLGRAMRRQFKLGLAQIARRVYLPEKEIRKYIK